MILCVCVRVFGVCVRVCVYRMYELVCVLYV